LSRSVRFDTSAWTPTVPRPIARAASAISGPRRPVMKSRTPRAASSCAEASPIPVDAPVMSATFPFSELLIQTDCELHLARQPSFAVGAGLPCPLEHRRTPKEPLRYVYFAVSRDPARMRRYQRHLLGGPFVQCVANGKVSPVAPSINICQIAGQADVMLLRQDRALDEEASPRIAWGRAGCGACSRGPKAPGGG